MTQLAATTPEWIGAIAGGAAVVVAIIGGIVATVRHYWGGFRPRVTAELAPRGDSIRVTIINRGRGTGKIRELDLLDAKGQRITVPGAGATFDPVTLEGADKVSISFNAPDQRDFHNDDIVMVAWGKKRVRKQPLPGQVSHYKDPSNAGPSPPGSAPSPQNPRGV